MGEQTRKIKELWPWIWTWRRPWSVSASCGLGVGDVLQFCGYFEHQRRVQFEGCAAEPMQTITAILPGSKWSPSHHWPMILFQGPRGVWQSSSFLVWPRVAASACIFSKALCCASLCTLSRGRKYLLSASLVLDSPLSRLSPGGLQFPHSPRSARPKQG